MPQAGFEFGTTQKPCLYNLWCVIVFLVLAFVFFGLIVPNSLLTYIFVEFFALTFDDWIVLVGNNGRHVLSIWYISFILLPLFKIVEFYSLYQYNHAFFSISRQKLSWIILILIRVSYLWLLIPCWKHLLSKLERACSYIQGIAMSFAWWSSKAFLLCYYFHCLK